MNNEYIGPVEGYMAYGKVFVLENYPNARCRLLLGVRGYGVFLCPGDAIGYDAGNTAREAWCNAADRLQKSPIKG